MSTNGTTEARRDGAFEGKDGRIYREVDRKAHMEALGMTRANSPHIFEGCCEGCAAWPLGGSHDPYLCKMLPECGVGMIFVEVPPTPHASLQTPASAAQEGGAV